MAPRRAGPVAASPENAGGDNRNERKRIVFNLGLDEYKVLEDMTRESGAESVTMMIREALRLVRVLQEQSKEGYSEVIVQMPNTLKRRLLVIDFLAPITDAGMAEPEK